MPSSEASPLAADNAPVDPNLDGPGLRVLVAIRQPLTRGTLVDALRRRGFRAVPGGSGPGPLVTETQEHAIDTIIIDAGVDVDDLRSQLPDVRLLVLDPGPGDGRSRASTNAHSAEYVPPDVSLDDLTAILNGERTASEAAARRPHRVRRIQNPKPPTSELTSREQEVLRALMSGGSSSDIAQRLGISRHTVRSHLQNVFGKLGVHTRLEAVAVALQAGMRPSPAHVTEPSVGGGAS